MYCSPGRDAARLTEYDDRRRCSRMDLGTNEVLSLTLVFQCASEGLRLTSTFGVAMLMSCDSTVQSTPIIQDRSRCNNLRQTCSTCTLAGLLSTVLCINSTNKMNHLLALNCIWYWHVPQTREGTPHLKSRRLPLNTHGPACCSSGELAIFA